MKIYNASIIILMFIIFFNFYKKIINVDKYTKCNTLKFNKIKTAKKTINRDNVSEIFCF